MLMANSWVARTGTKVRRHRSYDINCQIMNIGFTGIQSRWVIAGNNTAQKLAVANMRHTLA